MKIFKVTQKKTATNMNIYIYLFLSMTWGTETYLASQLYIYGIFNEIEYKKENTEMMLEVSSGLDKQLP